MISNNWNNHFLRRLRVSHSVFMPLRIERWNARILALWSCSPIRKCTDLTWLWPQLTPHSLWNNPFTIWICQSLGEFDPDPTQNLAYFSQKRLWKRSSRGQIGLLLPDDVKWPMITFEIHFFLWKPQFWLFWEIKIEYSLTRNHD